MRRSGFLKGLKFALIAVAAFTAFGWIVMSLWNILMPSIFGLRAITFGQALGLLLLSKLLFGGFRPSGRGRGPWRRGMMERWEKMSPEEREKFRQGMRRGCGFGREAERQERPSEVRA